PDRGRRGPSGTGRAHRAPRRPDVGGRSRGRGARPGSAGVARGAHGVACAGLPAGAGGARRGVHGSGSAGRDRACDQALRAPSGFVVQARSPGALAERGRGGPPGTSAAGPGVGRTTGYSLITSWHRDAPPVIAAFGVVPSSSFDRPSG